MAIDKRINYQWGGPGGKSPGSGGKSNGSADRGGQAHQAAAAQAQASASADRGGKAQQAAAEKAQKAAAEARANAREKAIQTAAITTKTATKSPHKDTKEQIEEQKELDIARDWEFQDRKALEPTVPPARYKEKISHTPFSEGPITTNIKDYYSPTGYQDLSRATTGTMGERTWGEQAEAGIPRSGIMGTLGKALKWGVMALVPGLLPAKLAKAYTMYNQAKTISHYAKKAGLTQTDIMSGLTSNLKGDLFSGKGTTTDTRDDRFDQRDRQEQKIEAPRADVVTESIQKFTQPQLTDLRSKRDTLQRYANTGRLNERGQNTLMQLNQMLEQAVASVAHGGFIDKPLMGRNRYL